MFPGFSEGVVTGPGSGRRVIRRGGESGLRNSDDAVGETINWGCIDTSKAIRKTSKSVKACGEWVACSDAIMNPILPK
jgi:hypothetical protein